jgi:hypothetical protein
MEFVSLVEFVFLMGIITLCLIIAFGCGLWRAIELQNKITDVITDLTLVQTTLDVVQGVVDGQLAATLNGAIATQQLYNEWTPPILDPAAPNPYTFNKWAECMSTPFPYGTLLPGDLECDAIYLKVAEGVHR